MPAKGDKEVEEQLWDIVGDITFHIDSKLNPFGVVQALADLVREKQIEAKIEMLERLKGIDCFHEHYTTDPRPAKFVSIFLEELKSEQS